MAKHVVSKAIFGKDIRDEVAPVSKPVIRKLLRTKYKYRTVPQLVVLDHSQCSEGLAEANAVGEDAAAVGVQLVDDAVGGVTLDRSKN